jgi:hypothetical protein
VTRLALTAGAFAALSAALIAQAPQPAPKPAGPLYELRVYTAAKGKLDALNARFRDHTAKLFEKHGMTNVGYWVPIENKEEKLYYVLSYPSPEGRKQSWAAFLADPDWKRAAAESEKDGKLVAKIEEFYLVPTDYSPAVKPTAGKDDRVFELRTYTASSGNLGALNARFRDHTLKLFEKHGMTNLWYWTAAPGQKGGDDLLVYFLAHKSAEARDKSFEAFRKDPVWVKAREASEQKAGGPLTVKDGVKSVLMKPTDYSPIQ